MEPIIERYAPRFVVLSGVSALIVLMAWLGIALRYVERRQHPNLLSQSQEGYLQACQYQLVPWQPWTDATLEEAARMNRPVAVDLGAFWSGRCARIGRDLYQDSGVADILKREFVPIKLDADAAPKRARTLHMIAEALGLPYREPLVVLFTPDGKPFGATAPETRAELMRLLEDASRTYRNAPDEVKARAQQLEQQLLARWVRAATPVPMTIEQIQQINERLLALLETMEPTDWSQPQPYWINQSEWLLAQAEGGDPRARRLLMQRLTALRESRLWDGQGGGFFTLREGIDEEGKARGGKRLIENARLLSLYVRAARWEPAFYATADALLDFLRTQLWQERPPGFRASAAPLRRPTPMAQTLPQPTLDTTLYADGNALAILALLDYVDFSRDEGRSRWAIDAATRTIETLRGLRTYRGDLYHSTRRQVADWLPDLALVARAAIRLYRHQRSERTLQFAQALLQLIERDYHDPTGGYYDVARGKRWAGWTLIPLRLSMDTELPADNALVALAQLELAQVREEEPTSREWRRRAGRTLEVMLGDQPETLERFAGFALAANQVLRAEAETSSKLRN